MKKNKIVFMGTPEFAVPVLRGLIENYQVVLVVTQPDKLVGRHQELIYSPVKKEALQANIPLFQPEHIQTDYQPLIDTQPDIIITCAYGQIIPETILNLPHLGCINVHASLLPALRGGAPIHKALINGYEKTGITIMYMDKNMDTGDIIAQEEYVIKDTDNVGTLHDVLSKIGANLLLATLPSIFNGTNQRIPQDHTKATYAYNIKRSEEHLYFNRPTKALINQIRGLNPWPLANLILNNEEIKILTAEEFPTTSNLMPGTIIEVTKNAIVIKTQDSALAITSLKPFGKRAMTTKEYLNGNDKSKLIHKIVE